MNLIQEIFGDADNVGIDPEKATSTTISTGECTHGGLVVLAYVPTHVIDSSADRKKKPRRSVMMNIHNAVVSAMDETIKGGE